MDFTHIDDTKKLRLAKQLLDMFSIDFQMILDEHDSENPYMSNLSMDSRNKVSSCLNSLFDALEEMKE